MQKTIIACCVGALFAAGTAAAATYTELESRRIHTSLNLSEAEFLNLP